jgi:tetratricopeptide (TPR) repeat protein
VGRALLQIGEALLARGQYRRAKGTFEKYLSFFPEPEGQPGPGTFGLARAMQGVGELERAESLHRDCLAGGQLTLEQQGYSRSVLNYLAVLTPVTKMQPLGRDGQFAVQNVDLDRDGLDEIVYLDASMNATVFGLVGGKLLKKKVIPIPFQSWKAREEFHDACLSFFDMDGDGNLELIAYCGNKDHDYFPKSEISIFRFQNGSAHRLASALFPKADAVGCWVGDLNGDGTIEILACAGVGQRELRCYTYDAGKLELLWNLPLGSDPYDPIVTDVDGNRGDEILLPILHWKHFGVGEMQVGVSSVDPPRMLPFHAVPQLLRYEKTGRGRGSLVFSNFLVDHDRVVLENIQTEERPFLETGLYRIPRGVNGWGRPALILEDPDFQLSQGFCTTWGPPGEGKFLFTGKRKGRDVVSAGPLQGKRAMDILSMGPVYRCLKGQFDDDPHPEFALSGRDAFNILGVGDPGRQDRPVISAETMAFGTGIEVGMKMIEMGIHGEAARLFSNIAETSKSPEVQGAAWMGLADALERQGKLRESFETYQKATSIASTQGHAFLGAARCLNRLQAWTDLKQYLTSGLERFSLSASESEEARILLSAAEPLAKETFRVEFGNEDWPLLVPDPIAVRFQDGEFVFSTSGHCRTFFGIPLQWHGNSFRLSARVTLERLDWGTGLVFSMQSRMQNLEGPKRDAVSLAFSAGSSTTFPQIHIGAFANEAFCDSYMLQTYPPEYPSEYGIQLTYSREKRAACLRIQHVEDSGRFFPLQYALQPGPYVLCISAGSLKYRGYRCRVRVKDFSLSGPRTLVARIPAESGHLEHRLALAGGCLVLGRLEEAEERFTKILKGVSGEPSDAPDDFPLYLTNLGWKTRTLLFRGMARFRKGNEIGAMEDIASAFSLEPVHTLEFFYNSYPILTKEERACIAWAFQKAVNDPKGTFAVNFPSEWESWKYGRFYRQADKERVFADWEKARTGRNSQGLFLILSNILPPFFDARFASILFSGRREGEILHKNWITNIPSYGKGLGSPFYAREACKECMAETPDDPYLLSCYAWLLIKTRHKNLQDHKKAIALGKRGADSARKRGDRIGLAYNLRAIAAAHFAKEDPRKACELQKEALRELPEEQEKLRKAFRKQLAEFEKAANKQGK